MRQVTLFTHVFVFFSLLSTYANADSAIHQHLKLSTVAQPPLGSGMQGPGFLEQLAREAFHRIGREIDVDSLPGDRALVNADAGINDGDLMRAPGFEKSYPNLIQVPEKIDDMDFVAYTNRSDIKGPLTWNNISSYAVAYTVGWKIYDRNVKAREISRTRNINDLFSLLEKKRADIVLIDRWQGQYAATVEHAPVHIVEPPLATSPMFIYLNNKHADLVPRLARALAKIKADGTYKKIYDASLRPYEIHSNKQ